MSNLGSTSPTAEFKRSKHYYARFALPPILLGVILTCSGAFMLTTSQAWDNTAFAKTLVVLSGLGSFAIGCYLWLKDLRDPDLHVLVFPNGILLIQEGIESTALWDDVAAVWRSIKVRKLFGLVAINTSHTFTIQLADGKTFRFHDAIENVEELGSIIQEQVIKRRSPHIYDALKKGNAVSFGELSVNARGLSYKQKSVPWHEVESFKVVKNSIHIRERGKRQSWVSFKVAEMPNVPILLALVVKYHTRRETQKPPQIKTQTPPPVARPRVVKHKVARVRPRQSARATWVRWIVAAIVGLTLVAAAFWVIYGDRIQLYNRFNDAALAPDSKLLVTVHGQGWDKRYTLRVWDTTTGELVQKLYSDNLMWIVEWSPDSKLLATGNHVGIDVWDTSNWHIRHHLIEATEKSNDLAWSPDSQQLASGDRNGVLRVWDVSSGDLVHKLVIHDDHISAVAWSPDGKLLSSGSWDYTVHVVDAASGTLLHTFNQSTSYISGLVWSSDSQRLASGCLSGVARIFDVAQGRELHTLEAHKIAVRDLAWSPDGNLLATLGNNEVRVWDSASGQAIDVLDNYGASRSSVVWSPDGQQIASAGRGIVRVWTIASGEQHQLSGHERSSGIVVLGWSPDAKRLITAGAYDKTIRIWNVSDQSQLYVMKASWVEAVWNALLLDP